MQLLLTRADVASRQRLISEWQTSYGNTMVQRVVGGMERPTAAAAGSGQRTRHPATPRGRGSAHQRSVFRHQPPIHWRYEVKAGGEASGEPRTPSRLFKGDRLTVYAIFPPLTKEQKDSVGFILSSPGHNEPKMLGWQGSAYAWEITAAELGDAVAMIEADPSGWAKETHNVRYTVVSDFQEFLRSCLAASELLGEKFDHAFKRVNDATQAYQAAFQDQKLALDRVSAEEKMEEEMLWGAFMAVLAFPIGALGGWAKELHALKSFSDIAKEGVCDLSKEIAKFSIESMKKMGEEGPELEGPRKPTGQDPLEFLVNFSSQLFEEKATNQHRLRMVVDAAGRARDKKRGMVFDQDPEKMVEKDTQIATIQGMSVEPKSYLRELWAAWIREYSWKVEWHTIMRDPHEYGPRRYYTAEENIGRKIKREINRAAKICGEDGEAWIKQWSAETKARAEREAAAESQKERDLYPLPHL